jgi:hypothetical protein
LLGCSVEMGVSVEIEVYARIASVGVEATAIKQGTSYGSLNSEAEDTVSQGVRAYSRRW